MGGSGDSELQGARYETKRTLGGSDFSVTRGVQIEIIFFITCLESPKWSQALNEGFLPAQSLLELVIFSRNVR